MSYITQVIVIGSWLDEDKRTIDLNYGPFNVLLRVDEHAGGNKAFTSPVWLGAINRLDLDVFIDSLKKGLWKEPERLQLFVRKEDDSLFSELKLDMPESRICEHCDDKPCESEPCVCGGRCCAECRLECIEYQKERNL